jgi:Glu-tRNA(Gln) amidotransferase subunit E-like FAD-binding protein
VAFLDTPDTWLQLFWFVLVAAGAFFTTRAWDWITKDVADRREYRQRREQADTDYARSQYADSAKALHENALALQGLATAIQSMMEHLEGMAQRDEEIQRFLMVSREKTDSRIEHSIQRLSDIQHRQEQIGSELLAYAMGKDPQRRTDYTVLQQRVKEQADEIEFLSDQLGQIGNDPAQAG